jgi:glutamyl/glutaminyl-tRNA synthetase
LTKFVNLPKIKDMTITTKILNRTQKLIRNIAQEFELSKISKSPARFSKEKLSWFNREYIKMLSLEEFCYRASELKIKNSRKSDEPKNLRIGGYVYLVDLETQKVLANKGITDYGQDGEFYYIGGGKNKNEDPIAGVIREAGEETNGRVIIDPTKLVQITNINVMSKKDWHSEGKNWDGKDMTFYFYPLKKDTLEAYWSVDGNKKWWFDWYDLSEVIGTNHFINYPIWKEFCQNNKLEILPLDKKTRQQYLGWNLDKNRATTLLDFETESECILSYKTCPTEDLKWKKISLKESLANLKEVLEFIKTVQNPESYHDLEINQLPEYFNQSTLFWETTLKNWLKENNKDAGSYFWPLRVALSGKAKSPSPFEILSILDIEQVKERINNYL